MKFIYQYIKPFIGIMIVGLLIKTIGTLIELALPYILSYILDDLVPNDGRLSMIILWGGIMILCALLALLCNVKANRMASKVARDCTRKIRHDLFYQTITLSGKQLDYFTIPSLEARITTDTYNVQNFIGRIQRLGVRAPLLLMGGLVVTLIMDAYLSLVMIAILPIIFIVVLFISLKGVKLYASVQDSVDGMVRVVREDTQGIRVIKALSKVEKEQQRYDKVNKKLINAEKKASLAMGFVNPIMSLLMNLGITFVVLIGAYRVMNRQTEPGKIVAFTQYFTMISTATLSITRIFMMYTKSSASASRIAEVMNTVKDLEIASLDIYPLVENDDYIVFDNVSFSYNQTKDNLKNISFRLSKGQTLGIIGATGSGKTTLVHLLMRFYDVNKGAIRIGGKDIRTIPEKDLHTLFGIVMQNDFLFSDTILENIRFGREISQDDIEKAIQISQAYDFIMSFPEGLNHVLSQKATNISGGQKQRLLIARALADHPEILILDDSSSALDYKTDANLRKAILQNLKDTTSIIVTQRVSSVMNADLIIVLEEGEIIGMGNHQDLLNTCEVYKEISESQIGGSFID
ncbi:MAG: ABC transporter ATP-binding protein [Bacilli bacterium]|jgi:ABC transporter transmembrane region|nr:ABC transporter ATP-binding protein [Bacilli bacterium]